MSESCGCAVLACRPFALSAEERSRSQALHARMVAAVQGVRPRDGGYSWRFAADPGLFVAIAEWITLEGRCCPFLSFDLHWGPEPAEVWLHLYGPEGTAAFLAEELPELPVP